MTYSTPIATIASIGAANTPIPVTIESETEPTTRPSGQPLQVGDVWYDNLKKFESIYVLKNNLDVRDGRQSVVRTMSKRLQQLSLRRCWTYPLHLTPSSWYRQGGFWTYQSTPSEPSRSIRTRHSKQSKSMEPPHSTPSSLVLENGVAINASAGEITAQWLNIGKNPNH
jgi:hypothetical protein